MLDMKVQKNVLRKWVKEFAADPQQALLRARADEARAVRDRTAPARSPEAQGRARYPKKLWPKRRHSTIGHLNPIEFGRQARLA